MSKKISRLWKEFSGCGLKILANLKKNVDNQVGRIYKNFK